MSATQRPRLPLPVVATLLAFVATCAGPSSAREAEIPDVTVVAGAPDLARVGAVLTRAGVPFSGYVIEREGARVVSRTPFHQGYEEGLAEAWYPSGALRNQKTYHRGKREGTHRSYWPDGKTQSTYRYHEDLFEGEQRAFFATGAPAELTRYRAGREDGRQRFWDPEGRLVANYTFKDGRRYGLVGRFDCMSVREDSSR